DRPATGMPVNAPAAPARWQEPDWPVLVETLGLRGAGQQLAANCVYRRREGATVHLEISAAHQHMATDQLVGRLEEALTRHFGENLKVRIHVGEGVLVTPAVLDEQRDAEKLAAARVAVASDPRMRELCETFGTQVNPDLVKPAD
ncbi:MAG TPA: DNA polymerase III subunit gamma/tau C-terminal domain-containing protein, partial [Gammaproteobacteria bacterium]|nr:DNA polymerase III subunit gamma/tau C-terminal domain-containing protein [Gammaproteobacteria bacterium]